MSKILLSAAVVLSCGCGMIAEERFDPASVEPVIYTETVPLKRIKDDVQLYPEVQDASVFVPVTLKESVRLFSEKGTGIVVYSEEDCLWCQKAMPVLAEALRLTQVNAYHVDTAGKIKPEDYDTLCGYISDIFLPDPDSDTTSFYIPAVIAVKDGVITAHHISLTEDYDPEEAEELSEEQYLKLLQTYTELIGTLGPQSEE
ncbi:MAG: hypothetical protein IKG46_09990 [Solobacterium sp.]|nr:hypothetical protein [Solobacterium sp.]